MSGQRVQWPATALVSALAGLTTWLTMLAWTGFAERPSGYLAPIFGACFLVAVTGMLLRSVRLHPLLVLLAEVVVLATWLHHRWAGDLALGGWLPTGDSIQMVATTLREAGVAAGQFAAPIPKTVPQFYPLPILVGAGVAVLVDLLACGLRRAPLAGLPLLAVYTAPVSILDGGVSWLKFALAAISFLFLVAGEEAQRLAHWGHQLSAGNRLFDSQATQVRTQAVWGSARKIGLTATGLAVLVPIFVPTITAGIFDGNGKGGGGGDAVSISNPMVDMKRDLSRGVDVELVRVTTRDPDPSYLRIAVLDSFDGEAWRPSRRDIPVKQRVDGPLPGPPGLDPGVPTTRVQSTIETSDYFRSRWLPTPYPAYSVTTPGDWRYDRNTLDLISAAKRQTAAGLTYQVQGLDITPAAFELADAGPAPASVFGPGTALPAKFPESVRKLARTVTAGATSKFEMAVRLQRWFRTDGHFTYSLHRAPGNGIDELVHFLGTGKGSRTGYCEQFAAAMAVMGRAVGIPSRVSVGFLRPDAVHKPNTWVYSSHDLHAWPEMYFQGAGWVRFEPTPQARTGSAVPAYTRGQINRSLPSQSVSPSSALNGQQNRIDRQSISPGAGKKSGGSGSGWDTSSLVAGFSAALLVLALLGVPRLLRGWLRARRWSRAGTAAALAEAAWAELRATARDLGVAWDDHVTLRVRGRDLTRAFGAPQGADDALTRAPLRGPGAAPEAVAALGRLVRLLERARYARDLPAGSAAAEDVRRDTEACVDALRAGASRGRRTRATWWPASLAGALRGATARGVRLDRPLAAESGIDRAV